MNSQVHCLNVHRESKTSITKFSSCLRQTLADFHNSFTVILVGKVAIQQSSNISPYYVAAPTLPCEMLMMENCATWWASLNRQCLRSFPQTFGNQISS